LQWLNADDWRTAFPQINNWFSYGNTLPVDVLSRLCAAQLGQAPMLAVVEHPWQAQWVTQQCMAYFSAANIGAAPLPQVMTLGQWLALDAQSQPITPLTERQAIFTLCQALSALKVESIRSDAARYTLASDMVAMLKEMDTRAALSPAIAFAGQDAHEKLSQTPWLSREASWLSVAKASLYDIGKPLSWQMALQASQRLANHSALMAVLPAPHPSLAMQAFLSQLPADSAAMVCCSALADTASSAASIARIEVQSCVSFEQEAVQAAQTIQTLVLQDGEAKNVVVVAHDRVLARRCAALLARSQVPVEDRVGWALSTTVSSTVLRGLLSSWQGSDVPALMAWLGLPIVAAHWPEAKATLRYLRQQWQREPITPEGRAFVRKAIAASPSQAIQACLQHWQAAQSQCAKPMPLAQFSYGLQTHLSSLSNALQADAAGSKVWQVLQSLGLDDEPTLISLATFVAVLDDALESERFSASTLSHSDMGKARVIFAPLYEAAWTGDAPLVMLGCNEAHFPASPRNPTPMLGSVRRELGLSLPTTERAVWLHLLAQTGKPIYATFTPSEAGNPSRLSPWLLGASLQMPTTTLPEPVPTEPVTMTEPKQAAQLRVQSLPDEVSVTKLAAVLQCPYRFALNAVFGVAPLPEPAAWPSHLERGNVLHEALHHAQADLQTLGNVDDLENKLKTALQAILQDKLPLSGRYAALIADSQRTLSTEGWRLQAAEHPIESTQLIDGVRVHGKLDRLDVIRDATGQAQGYAVMDYKTSSEAVLKQKRDEPLLDAQLALYAVLLELQDMPAAQAAYWRLHDGLHESATVKDDYHSKKTVLAIEDLPLHMDSVQHAVQSAWQNLATSGAAPATPSEAACQYCAYRAVCRSADLALDGDSADD
jgi:ATP-dependent helicase/nuclease subunit B